MTNHDAVGQRNALWVYAHPRQESLNGRLFHAGVDKLSQTRTVVTSDLYAQDFDPRLGERDLGSSAGVRGNISEQQGEAYARGEIAADVRAEQEKLSAADLLVLQFPLWWYGTPAILKGWIDRVFAGGYAYGETDPASGLPRRYGDGGLVGRKALVVVTAGEDPSSIGPRGISGDIDSLLFPLTHGALWYTGIETLDLHVIYDADSLRDNDVEHEVTRLTARLDRIDAERSNLYRRLKDLDYAGTRTLRADIHPERTDLGIHLSDR